MFLDGREAFVEYLHMASGHPLDELSYGVFTAGVESFEFCWCDWFRCIL